MRYLGIDIGSTCAKTVVINEERELVDAFLLPTGWSSFDAMERISVRLRERGYLEDCYCVATGYGRAAVSFADRVLTEITCHARGASVLFGSGKMNVIDIGGQDSKMISIEDGRVEEFFMNDKCSAGTGKFLEVMANRLQVPIAELDRMAKKKTEEITISSMCTVFAESEIISLAGKGVSKENIAWAVLRSIARKVRSEYSRLNDVTRPVYLTGGLCDGEFFLELLTEALGRPVHSVELARYAGALGAAHLACDSQA